MKYFPVKKSYILILVSVTLRMCANVLRVSENANLYSRWQRNCTNQRIFIRNHT